MKWLQLILVSVLAFNVAQPQHLLIKNYNRNIRAGFQSGLGFSIDKKFDSIGLRVTQGTVERQGNIIMLWPATDGKDTLIAAIYYKHRNVFIDTLKFDIIKPEIFPSFGGDLIRDRKLTLTHLKAFGGIIFHIRITDDHWERAGVESYRFSILRKDSCIYSKIEN
ncbi:MAG TPA: hypothetical protein VL307_06365 [Chitinophagaceae bacterium]|nr:hypothetical protein [Chitinophagaceae bacterium]